MYVERLQVMRKWRFRTNVVNSLSTECKQQVTQLMEPEAKARPTAGAIFNGAWIGMDPRLTSSLFISRNIYSYNEHLILRDGAEVNKLDSPLFQTDSKVGPGF
jgi:hypothetical protein